MCRPRCGGTPGGKGLCSNLDKSRRMTTYRATNSSFGTGGTQEAACPAGATVVVRNIQWLRACFLPTGVLRRPKAPRLSLVMTGSYALLVHVEVPITVAAGGLGSFSLEPGYYLYVGSARRGMGNRLARHACPRKKLRWHIDYLTTARGVQVLGAVVAPAYEECTLHQALREAGGSFPVVPGFGASDCLAGCGSHLLRLTRESRLFDEIVHGAERH